MSLVQWTNATIIFGESEVKEKLPLSIQACLSPNSVQGGRDKHLLNARPLGFNPRKGRRGRKFLSQGREEVDFALRITSGRHWGHMEC